MIFNLFKKKYPCPYCHFDVGAPISKKKCPNCKETLRSCVPVGTKNSVWTTLEGKAQNIKDWSDFREKRDYPVPSLCISISFPSGEKFVIKPFKISEIYPELRISILKYKDLFVSLYVDYFYQFYKDKLLSLEEITINICKASRSFFVSQIWLDNMKLLGVKKVEIYSTLDDNICNSCLMSDGEIFDIDQSLSIPLHRCDCHSKPHGHCRCRLNPVSSNS